ncbi:MAG: low molecular weight protein arginine phosphatase [Lentisphaerae bacterium]|nr:low molecular weight protein arginine phosphatase [Lentisphaerota bacterium]MCP4099994.1 low molecular weight protein arginine phosphatase [Lentisphaerota bacterium]
MKVLFVCTGNTCRSPMAEKYFSKLCSDAGRVDIEVLSAGTFAGPGGAPSANAAKVMSDYGIEMQGFTSSSLTPVMVEDADIIVVMTSGHRSQIVAACPEAKSKVRLLMEFKNGGDVADPFGGDYETYKQCFDEMKEALENLFLDLIKNSK